MTLLPHTAAGKWAARCLALSILLFGAFFALVASGQRGGDTFFSNPSLTVTILGSGVAAIAAGVLGLFALWHNDRSLTVMMAVTVGMLATLWSVAELAFPH